MPLVFNGNPLSVGPLLVDRNNLFIVALTLVLAVSFFLLFPYTRVGLYIYAHA